MTADNLFKSALKLEKKDFWVLLLIRPPFTVLINYWLIGSGYFELQQVFLKASLIGIVATVISWRLHVYVDRFTRQRFPEISDIKRRVLWAAFFHIQITIASTTILSLIFENFNWVNEGGYFKAIATGFCTNLSAMGFHEGIYLFHNWKVTHSETEELKKNNLKSRLVGLQSRVNPHFLFNSINTLSSLIEEDVEKAEIFLDELCKVYRYMLQVEKMQLINLATELEAVKALFHILKTRFGEGIALKFSIDPRDEGKLVPILTLQQILEGIVEQNVIDRNNPLRIEIRSRVGMLEIGNLIRNKSQSQVSEDERLEHIISKYKLMGLPEVRNERLGMWRWVKLPLIEKT